MPLSPGQVPGIGGVCGELLAGFLVQFAGCSGIKKRRAIIFCRLEGLKAVNELLISIILVFPLEVGV